DALLHEIERVVEVPRACSVEPRLAEVHSDVEHDARSAHPLTVEHAQSVARGVKVSEVLHESLGVGRPAFRVTSCACELAPPRVELGTVVNGLAELQVVTGNTLVVDGRRLTPRVELGDAGRH